MTQYFSMGDFYVSALLYRHDVFVGAPVMPLLYSLTVVNNSVYHLLEFLPCVCTVIR